MNKNQKSTTGNQNTPSVTYITESTHITADMTCDDDLRIAGTIKGEIQSKKKVMITESGKIDGTINTPDADISGKVTGDVRAANRLVLRSSAIIDGKIFTKKLTIENGAQVKGSFDVGPNVSVAKNGSGTNSDSSSEKNKSS